MDIKTIAFCLGSRTEGKISLRTDTKWWFADVEKWHNQLNYEDKSTLTGEGIVFELVLHWNGIGILSTTTLHPVMQNCSLFLKTYSFPQLGVYCGYTFSISLLTHRWNCNEN